MGVTLRHHFSNSHSALRHEYSAGRTATDGPAIVRTCGSGGAVTDCPLLCSHCSAEGLPQRGSGFPLEYRCSPCLRHLPRRVSLTSVLNSDAFDAELPRRVSLPPPHHQWEPQWGALGLQQMYSDDGEAQDSGRSSGETSVCSELLDRDVGGRVWGSARMWGGVGGGGHVLGQGPRCCGVENFLSPPKKGWIGKCPNANSTNGTGMHNIHKVWFPEVHRLGVPRAEGGGWSPAAAGGPRKGEGKGGHELRAQLALRLAVRQRAP